MDDLIATDALSSAARKHRANLLAEASKRKKPARKVEIFRGADNAVVGYGVSPAEMQVERQDGRADAVSFSGRSFKVERDEAGRFTGLEEQ